MYGETRKVIRTGILVRLYKYIRETRKVIRTGRLVRLYVWGRGDS